MIGEFKTSSDDYIIQEEIGYGEYATVYKALYKPTNQIVAVKDIIIIEDKIIKHLKLLEEENGEEGILDKEIEENRTEILREIEILKVLSDDCKKYFICYIDYFIKDYHIIIITSYLENYETLFEASSKLIILDINILKMILNISNGLKLLHSKGIAHRDLNRGNILLSKDDITDIKIIDFGLSCFKENCDTDKREGGMEFFDPKIYKLRKNSNLNLYIYQQGDLWALGIIIYKLITNEYPIELYNDHNINIDDYYRKYKFSEDPKHDIIVEKTNMLNNIYNIHIDLDNLLSQTETRRYLYL